MEQSRLGIFISKEIFEGGMIRIHNAFVHDEGNQDWSFSQFSFEYLKGFNTLFGEEEWGIFLKKTGHRSGYLQKVFYESSIETGMTKKVTNTLDGSGMRIDPSLMLNRWFEVILNENLKFSSIPQRLDEDYHFIKDDIPLVSVYSTRNVLFRGMLIPDAFLTDEIRATDDYKENETVFVAVEVLMNQPQLVVSTQGTHRTIPKAHRTRILTTASPQGRKGSKENVAKVQEKLAEDEIEKMVKGEEDEESYASMFVDSMLNDDDDFDTKIEPESHKENPKVIDDDDVNDKEKQDEKKDDDVKKTDDAAMEKDNDDYTDHTFVRTHATGSIKNRNEQMETPIPTPNRSPKKDLSLDKTIYEELMANVSPTTATTSKTKSKRGFTSNKIKILPRSIAGMCR
uniref:Uncharacterized protein n=1 Tax=Tanacetum cinerariifolium TaxID=118510 RepID=A0A6L2NKI4_TANCI|nr:hypothetical protein [Tanacetum cinerariifolium]